MSLFKIDINSNISLGRELKTTKTLACIKNNILADKYSITKRIGRPSANGEVYLSLVENKQVVIKKIPLTNGFFRKYKKGLNSAMASKSVFLTELVFLYICNTLQENNVTHLLPYTYIFNICDQDCGFKTNKIKEQHSKDQKNDNYIKGCGYLVTEKAEGDLANFLDTYSFSYPQLLIIFYQIFSSLFTLKYYTNFYHADLHYGNVLFKKVNPAKGFIKYKLGDSVHFIPNIGFNFFIWDFGTARSLPFISNPDYDIHFKNFEHLDDFIGLINRLHDKNPKEKKLKKLLQKHIVEQTSLSDFLDKIHEDIQKIRKYTKGKDVVLDSFNVTKDFKGSDKLFLDSFEKVQKRLSQS